MEIQRESIFVSSLRGFFRTLFVLLGIFAACLIGGFIFSLVSSPYTAEEKTRLEILPDLNWNDSLVSLNAPAILQINIHGVIGDPEHLNTELIQHVLFDSRKGLLANNRVKGLLLHFDTPGGTVVDSDNIYRLLLQYKEKFHVPVFGFVSGLCASGGMYISSAADRMYCSPPGLVGSVGVVMGPFFNFSDAIAKIGVQAKTLTQGLDKDMMNPFRAWKVNEDQNLSMLAASFYQKFVDIVTSARPHLNRQALIDDYGAKIFDSSMAQELGYIDVSNASYEMALADLLKEANIDSTKPYQIVELKPERHFLSDLIKGRSPLFNGTLEHTFKIGSDKAFVIQDQFAYLYQP